jgi:hypothetical protein
MNDPKPGMIIEIPASLLALAALAFVAAAAMAWFGLEGLPHLEDEMAYLFQAKVMARGELWAPAPENGAPFWVPFVLTVNGRRFGKYPPGWPAVLALGERLGAAWLVNPVLGALAVPLLYRLSHDLFDRQTAFLACLLMISSPMFLVLSGTLMAHSLTHTLTLVFMLANRRVERAILAAERSTTWAALGGAALGWIGITRPLTAVCIALPFLGLIVWRLGDGLWRQRTLAVRQVLVALAPMVAAGLVVTALYPAYLWALTGDPTTNLYTQWWPHDKIGFGPGIGPSEGHTLRQAVVNMRADLRLWSSDLFGWPGVSWIFLAPGIVAARRSAWAWTLLALFPVFVVVHLTYWVGSQVYGTRYYYEALPGLALLTAVGTRWLAGLTGRWHRAALAIVVGALLAINLATYLPERVRAVHGLYGITRMPLDQLAERQEGDILVVVRAEHWTEYGALMAQNSPWLDGSLVVAWDVAPQATQRVIATYPDHQLLYFYLGHFYYQKPY